MKRNESILVYSVTGLLVVILAVAILFGNDNSANAGELGKGLDDLELVRGPAPQGELVDGAPGDKGDKPAVDEAGANAKATDDGKLPAEAAGVDKLTNAGGNSGNAGNNASNPATAETPKTTPDAPVAQPLVAPGPIAPGPAAKPAGETDAHMQALVLLGESKRDGDYRIVTVRRGDTFSELVQRWCGNLDALPLAESLNEEANLANLKEGTKLCMPWVDDVALVAAHQARRTKVDAEVKVLNEARAQGRTYTVKAGDKLWNIAVAQVGTKNAAKFIEEIKALNPELLAHPDRLTVGKTILLPQR